jgi:MYXO-CTERM domain-containing protein
VSRRFLGLILGAALTFCASVQAAPTLCSAPGVHPDGLDTTDVSFAGIFASDCYGVATGIATASNLGFEGFAPALVGALPGGPAVTGSLQGIDFTLSTSGLDIGSWTLGWAGATGPVTLDVVTVVQTNLTFASYFFDDLLFSVSPGSGKGAWVINYLISEDIPILSSFSIYVRDFRGPGGETPPTEPPPAPVDEPGSAALVALGVLALVLARRRSKSA